MNSTALCSSKVMLLSACILTNNNIFDLNIKNKEPIKEAPYNKINFILKNKEIIAFNYASTAIEMIKDILSSK